jgi:hypothetical protein
MFLLRLVVLCAVLNCMLILIVECGIDWYRVCFHCLESGSYIMACRT